MINNFILFLEKVFFTDERFDDNQRKPYFLHTLDFSIKARNEETNENQTNNPDNPTFASKAASKSILKILPDNEIFGLEADSLQVNPGELLSTEENDLDKAFFEIAYNPCHNQLGFDYFLAPWETCRVRFKFLSKKIIDISTVDKMGIKERIVFPWICGTIEIQLMSIKSSFSSRSKTIRNYIDSKMDFWWTSIVPPAGGVYPH